LGRFGEAVRAEARHASLLKTEMLVRGGWNLIMDMLWFVDLVVVDHAAKPFDRGSVN
jgi:hypothetical protein